MPKKCNRCRDRFLCFSERFEPKEVIIPAWLFTIPKDEEGNHFLELARKYLNADVFKFHLRGRAKNRKAKGGVQSFQPLATADTIALYLRLTTLAKRKEMFGWKL